MAKMSKGQEKGLLYSLKVSIISGPVSPEFVQKNAAVYRVIRIRGTNTLEQLHRAIFRAFDRDDEHLYEFQFSDAPHGGEVVRYVHPVEMNRYGMGEPPPTGDVSRTRISSLNLKVGDVFLYWFDFGDDWWREVRVTAIDDAPDSGRYPKVVQKVGKSPPQYIEWDE